MANGNGYLTWTAETGYGFIPQEYGSYVEGGYPVSALAETGIFQSLPDLNTAVLPGPLTMPTAGSTIYGGGQVTEANILGFLGPLLTRFGPTILSVLGKYWPQLAGIAGSIGAGALIGGALGGGGEGGQAMIPGTDIALTGPFAPEPAAGIIAKEWAGIGGSRFYLLINGRVVVRRRNGTWRLIKRPKMLHMKVSNPRMGDVVRADRIVARTAKILRRRLK